MNVKNYLDDNGLATVLTALKSLFPLKTDIPEIQYTTMPTASVDNLGSVVQFIGTTSANYTNGYFYKCVSDGQDPATYSWEEVEVQTTPETVPTVVAATHANNFDMLNAAPGYYISTNVSDFYFNLQGEYHTNRPVPFFAVVKNIKDAAYQEVFAYGLYFEKSSSYEGGIGLAKFEKYNNTYANVYYNQLIMGVNGGTQYWSGVKSFSSIPKVVSYTTPTQDTELTAKKYVDDSGTALLSNVAPGYDSTATYSVGDYVTYNRILYKCNTAISTAEAWTAAHWTQTTVMAELNNTVGNINTTLATLATPSNNGGGA